MIHKEQSQLVVVTNVTRKNFICNAYDRVGKHFDQILENVFIYFVIFIRVIASYFKIQLKQRFIMLL